MMPKLKSLTVSNFRSIRGEITIPLDAPIVLIHGQNGAGKTSILAAIELGLTGNVASLSKNGDINKRHLIHKLSESGFVSLTVGGIGEKDIVEKISIKPFTFEGTPVLFGDRRRFFLERCYLAQATLSRLLELYQHQDTKKTDSALTRFVKDLLGLDRLDALIEGLHSAGHISRLRTAAPEFFNAREEIKTAGEALEQRRDELKIVDGSVATLREELKQSIAILFPEWTITESLEKASTSILEVKLDDKLQELARIRRDLHVAIDQWAKLSQNSLSGERSLIEAELASAQSSLRQWEADIGLRIESIFQELIAAFPNLPSPSAAGPEVARSSAFKEVTLEIFRCTSLIERDTYNGVKTLELQELIEQSKARLLRLDLELSTTAEINDGQAQLLTQMLSHIHTEDCPVCGRDYSETGDGSLKNSVLERITSLTNNATHLKALAEKRVGDAALSATAERELAALVAGRLPVEALNDLKRIRARLEELKVKLIELESGTVSGVLLRQRYADATRHLSEFRGRDESTSSLRIASAEIAERLCLPLPEASESLSDTLDRISLGVESQEAIYAARNLARRDALECIKSLEVAAKRSTELSKIIKDAFVHLSARKTAKAEADKRLESAKKLGVRAKEVRTAIVRKVFNDDLNQLWRDLFIRLAPEEPFVPAFALPESAATVVEAALETNYRAGGKGGDPRAMLSAGNLNTAALTLFLSLHLAAEPVLPWLIIDDPVQSMDEVHISQFAALLRTLAKQQKRQIIIAVHERTLFDYLALELSPAFEDDRLITIELGKAGDGSTTAHFEPNFFVPDRASFG